MEGTYMIQGGYKYGELKESTCLKEKPWEQHGCTFPKWE